MVGEQRCDRITRCSMRRRRRMRGSLLLSTWLLACCTPRRLHAAPDLVALSALESDDLVRMLSEPLATARYRAHLIHLVLGVYGA
jgi:hypothetical protein